MGLISALALLATGLGFGLAALIAGWAALRHRRRLAGRIMAGAGVWLAGYAAVLIGVSLISPPVRLGLNQPHCFDDICYSVTGLIIVPNLGPADQPVAASGQFYLVTLKLQSTARRQVQGLNTPVCVGARDENGRVYTISAAGQAAYDQAHTTALPAQIPWVRSLRPGEASERVFVFDLPTTVQAPGLAVTECPWITWFVIGDDNSLFHQPALFRLTP